jgi:hypothetical protein
MAFSFADESDFAPQAAAIKAATATTNMITRVLVFITILRLGIESGYDPARSFAFEAEVSSVMRRDKAGFSSGAGRPVN